MHNTYLTRVTPIKNVVETIKYKAYILALKTLFKNIHDSFFHPHNYALYKIVQYGT